MHAALVTYRAEPGPVTIRDVRINGVMALGWLATAGQGAYLAFARPNTAALVAGLILAVLGSLLSYRSWTAGLTIGPAGVAVRNVVRTRAWGWDKVGEFGWDQPGWNIRGAAVRCISVCPIGIPSTFTATTTACGFGSRETARFAEYAAALAPWAASRGVAVRLLEKEPSVARWPLDPRARKASA